MVTRCGLPQQTLLAKLSSFNLQIKDYYSGPSWKYTQVAEEDCLENS